ncbi:MAG: folate-binding protein YgfZ [Acidobacteria bacterium]|nr:folate-binding protein YgfZ [Acidobacteriota bacterium]
MLHAFSENAALFELPGRGRIKAFGEDRKRLLHAMSTNHVQQLEPGQGCYAFFLSAQGRVLSDVTILAQSDHLLLDVEPDRRAFIMEHLDKYIIADDVTLEDVSDQQTTLALEGPAAAEILESIGAPTPINDFDSVEWADRLVARTNYTGAAGFHIYISPLDAPVLRETLLDARAVEVSAETVEIARLLHAKPLYGVDITEANLPQETQLTHALHFSKGCYLGQEIVERVRSRGHVNKVLTRLQLPTPAAPGAKVMSGEKEVGAVTSSAFDPRNNVTVALAYVRVEALAPTAPALTVTSPDSAAPAS